MGFLTESLPTSLTINGVEYPINTDFRAVLRYNEMLKGNTEDADYLMKCMCCIYKKIPSDVAAALERLNWFMQCGKEEKKHRPPNKVLGINSNLPFDFDEDGELIYSAFRRNDVYGIDLLKIEYLHWWEFMAMLNDIPSDTYLSRVMEYRTIDTTNNSLSNDQKTFYKAMQRYHKIQVQKEHRNEELIQALKEGRDPTPYL